MRPLQSQSKWIETGRQLPPDMNPSKQDPELISALADGQLTADELAHALALCAGDAGVLAQWNAYHLVGDVLRSPGRVAHGADPAFLGRLRGRLSLEAGLNAVPVEGSPGSQHTASSGAVREASNDATFRWKLVAGFASIAAVAAVAWTAGAGLLAPAAGPQLAQSGSAQPVVVMSEQGAVLRDARMQELLAAHKQFGGTSALQMPSGFLRNATFEAPAGERR
jgi:sigma-E factor negative regulatory protein RseA